MATSLRLLLAPEHQVDTATSAEVAWEYLSTGEYDLVLCDLMMPGATGMELFHRTAKTRPHLSARFVFMTGGATSSAAQEFLARTRQRVLEKPFTPEQLQAVLR